jgi:hypothetical protein
VESGCPLVMLWRNAWTRYARLSFGCLGGELLYWSVQLTVKTDSAIKEKPRRHCGNRGFYRVMLAGDPTARTTSFYPVNPPRQVPRRTPNVIKGLHGLRGVKHGFAPFAYREEIQATLTTCDLAHLG